MNRFFFTLVALASTSLFAVSSLAQTDRPVRIQDLTALEEHGLKPEEVQKELAVANANAYTYPNQITQGNSPNMYTSGNHPFSVTSGSYPNGITSGNYPNSYTQGRPLFGAAAGEIPMPRLNF